MSKAAPSQPGKATRRPRLAIVTTHPVQYNAPFFRLLSERGAIDVHVFYTWDRDGGDGIDPEFGVEVRWDVQLCEGYRHSFSRNTSSAPGSHRFWGIQNPDLIGELNEWTPDAILIYGWNFRSHLQVMRHFKGQVPVWFRGDSHLLDEKRSIRTLVRRWVLRAVYRYVDRSFYCGVCNRDYYQIHGLTDKQLSFMPHCVDNEAFGGDDAQRQTSADSKRAEMGIAEDDIVILFVGKFVSRKMPLILLEAATKVGRALAERLVYCFVGDGEMKSELERVGQSMDARVIFLPFQNQSVMPETYRIGDVVVLPSAESETWGLVVNEAMACSRPAIVSNKVGCGPDLVVEGETGWSFTAGHADELAARLENIAERGRDGLREIGRRASEKIANWSFENAAIAIEHELIKR